MGVTSIDATPDQRAPGAYERATVERFLAAATRERRRLEQAIAVAVARRERAERAARTPSLNERVRLLHAMAAAERADRLAAAKAEAAAVLAGAEREALAIVARARFDVARVAGDEASHRALRCAGE
jgi:hypothetical protein